MRDRTNATLERLQPSVFPDAASQWAFRFQLGLAESQWFSPERLEDLQLQRLKSLADFAVREIPFWRTRIDAGAIGKAHTLNEALAQIPVLTRPELMANSAQMNAQNLPPGHNIIGELRTSGSTGAALSVRTTNVAINIQGTLTLRAHLWAGRDFSRALAMFRRFRRQGVEFQGVTELTAWDQPFTFPFPTGRAYLLNTQNTSLEQQWDWLAQAKPAYLLAYPTIVRGQALRAAREGGPPIRLESITTISEAVDKELREMTAQHLQTRLFDLYSSQEAGSMAIQCPDYETYHAHSEVMILEVLNERGEACAPGEFGRVVVTPLSNYATPLFRYEIGDLAERGAACACGRGLPVLNRILGRRRNLLTTPDGRHYWPAIGAKDIHTVLPIKEHQFRQTAPGTLEVLLVTASDILPEHEAAIRTIVSRVLPAKFDIQIRRVDAIPRPASGKHEEFVSLLT